MALTRKRLLSPRIIVCDGTLVPKSRDDFFVEKNNYGVEFVVGWDKLSSMGAIENLYKRMSRYFTGRAFFALILCCSPECQRSSTESSSQLAHI